MKLFFLGIFWTLFLATVSSQKGPFTEIDIEDVRTMAMVESKNILVSFGSGSSADSQNLNSLLLEDKSLNKVIQQSLIPVSVDMDNVDDFKWFADFRIVYVPTLAIINPLGEEVDRITGNITKDRVHTFFERFKEVDPEIFFVEESSAVASLPPAEIQEFVDSEPILNDRADDVLETEFTDSPLREETTEIWEKEISNITTASSISSYINIVTESDYRSAYRATINKAPHKDAILDNYIPQYRVVYASEGADFPPVALPSKSTKASVKKATSRSNQNTTAEKISSTAKGIPNNNQEFRIHFGTYNSMAIALKQIDALKKIIPKEIQIVENDSVYEVITRDLESRIEARSFVKESRAQGINCFLLNG